MTPQTISLIAGQPKKGEAPRVEVKNQTAYPFRESPALREQKGEIVLPKIEIHPSKEQK